MRKKIYLQLMRFVWKPPLSHRPLSAADSVTCDSWADTEHCSEEQGAWQLWSLDKPSGTSVIVYLWQWFPIASDKFWFFIIYADISVTKNTHIIWVDILHKSLLQYILMWVTMGNS